MHKFSAAFIRAEWDHVIAAWDLSTWQEYQTHSRLGRKSKLPEDRRAILWAIFERVRAALEAEGRMAVSTMFHKLTLKFSEGAESPYDFILVDEAQDMGLSQLRFFGALAGHKPNGLFFAGDIAQRIFQPAFSWATAGVDIRGRSRTLKVNYRTSHQIRQQADRLLEPEISDAEGQKERRDTTVSVFNGPPPGIQLFESEDEEIKFVAAWLKGLLKNGIPAQEIGVFVRSEKEIPRAELAVQDSGATAEVLDESVEVITDRISIGTMHFAKGLEFRAVAVMACDENVIPSEERIRLIGDHTDLQEAYETERHLLYVACTRAREMLLVSGLEPGSEFIADMTE
jgi:superfamily I DNA/RNA helicase